MFCVNILLTVQEERDIDEICGHLAEVARLSQQEPGCLRFEVYHSQSEPRVFLLGERWECEAAWIAHRNERAFREIYQPLVLPRVTRVPHISTLIS